MRAKQLLFLVSVLAWAMASFAQDEPMAQGASSEQNASLDRALRRLDELQTGSERGELARELESATAKDWSPYSPLLDEPPPRTGNAAWNSHPIDAFVFAKLENLGLEPAPLASRRSWLRRVSFDLTGLPPTPEELALFLGDSASDEDACAQVVDRLLASPRYGERWARHWLDVVRYADSDGFAIDGERPTLWRYRDYVVRSFNEDKPYDRFVREQIAGDELEAGSEGLIALGFYRLGPYEADNMTPPQRRQDFLDEITSAVGSVFLGLTMGCARCHDHKYDPIPTKDYYALQAFLSSLQRKDLPAPFLPGENSAEFERGKKIAEVEIAKRRELLAIYRDELRGKLAKQRETEAKQIGDDAVDAALGKGDTFSGEDKAKHKKLKEAIDKFDGVRRFKSTACSVSDGATDAKASPTRILVGGSIATPGDAVSPTFPTALRVAGFAAPSLDKKAAGGRRAELARWLTDPGHPLTGRVFINRVWQYHMGRGIVSTPGDFGVNGGKPTHPALLDYLTRTFIAGGWKLKPIHRLIVLSRTYRLSTRHPEYAGHAMIDPENSSLWRAHHRRLDSEEIRDSLLAVSGQLRTGGGGPGFYARIPDEMGTNFPFFTWNISSESDRRRRSLYIFQRRNMVVPMLEAFDAADMNASCERRSTSITTPQVFHFLNGRFVHDCAGHLARRVIAETGDELAARVDRLFLLTLNREPDPDERRACQDTYQRQLEDHQGRAKSETNEQNAENAENAADLAAFRDLALSLVNLNEFIYLD